MPADPALASGIERCLGGRVRELRRLSSGASRQTWAVDLADARGEVAELIFQRDRSGGAPGFSSGVRVEARLLEAARHVGVPVARVAGCGNWEGGDLGWLAVERLEGESIPRRILRDSPWVAARAALTAQCAEALARIHAIDPRHVEGLPRRDPLAEPWTLLDALGAVRPVLELGARWLRLHPVAMSVATTVHGDFRLGNLLVGPRGLVAVLDWELAHAGDRAEDLGWLCARSWRFGGPGHVAGVGELDELLAAYTHAGGEPISRERLRWWEAFAAVKWAVICALQASAHLGGATRSVELAAIGRRVCESEWDLLVVLDMAAGATARTASPPRAERPSSPLPRPTASELVEAALESLDRPDTDGRDDDAARYEARVLRGVLAMVDRELAVGPEVTAAHAERLGALGVASDAELVSTLRSGALDDRLDELGAILASSTLDQLTICNPGYATR